MTGCRPFKYIFTFWIMEIEIIEFSEEFSRTEGNKEESSSRYCY